MSTPSTLPDRNAVRRGKSLPRVSVIGLLFFLGSCGREPESLKNSLGIRMIRIESGTFQMGAAGSRDLWPEQPVHSVTISQPFYISETEITLDQFRQFRPSFAGTPGYLPYVAGVTWHDAVAFAKWLSQKEGMEYRLPTEAEWEYVARCGGRIEESSLPRGLDVPNPWGVKNLLAGPREWCLDRFGEYPAEHLVDPVGPREGLLRVVRGGPLDLEERNFLKLDFARPTARLAMPPSFGVPAESRPGATSGETWFEGLIGVWYLNEDLTDPQGTDVLVRLDNNWSNDPRGAGRWSANWRGYLVAPVTAAITFVGETTSGLRVTIADQTLVDLWETANRSQGTIEMEKGKAYPITVSFRRSNGQQMRVRWRWPGVPLHTIPPEALSHTASEKQWAESQVGNADRPGFHAIGFRLVQAPLPESDPWPAATPYVQQGVRRVYDYVRLGPDPSIPYYRKRYLLPTPPENSSNEEIDALGFHPSFRSHQHSPGLEVMPNGDLLLVIYTSYREYEPGVSLIATRLRYGADEWDMPSRFMDFVGVNDHAPLLWNDRGTVYLFWGNPKLAEGGFPFQWTFSRDSGATWEEIQFPRIVGRIGSHSRQPINTAFRDSKGRMYVSSDGSGAQSLLWASADNGRTWYDTGGRSAGRHTSFALLKGDRILGLGGKNSDIDGYMPAVVSTDGGKTYTVSKSPFPRQGTNQRPTLIRLQSGNLLFAGDFVLHNDGSQPFGVTHLGSYVALSKDEGKSWIIKKLIGVQLHENAARAERMRGPTLGYAVARQAPNGMIHLVGTMTNPCLHFEFNEAWILKGSNNERSDAELMASRASKLVGPVEHFEERYPSGRLKATWSGGLADDGRWLLHGQEIWYYESGIRQRVAMYRLGKKVGRETYWDPQGHPLWTWEHRDDGTAILTYYWPNGKKKAQSVWRNFMADGSARLWDAEGRLVQEVKFEMGHFGGKYAGRRD